MVGADVVAVGGAVGADVPDVATGGAGWGVVWTEVADVGAALDVAVGEAPRGRINARSATTTAMATARYIPRFMESGEAKFK